MNKIILSILLIISAMAFTTPARSAHIPDSLLTIDYIYNYTFSDYEKAAEIARIMRSRKMDQVFKLDIAEGDLYFNNGKYHQAQKYYERALQSDSVRLHDERSMKLMHRLISTADGLHNETKKAQYIDMLLHKAQAVGDLVMESIAMFNMGKMVYYQQDKERGYRLIRESIELMENSDYEYKKDNLIYDYNTLYIMQQRDQDFEEALKTLDKLAAVISETTDEDFQMEGINRKELKSMYAHRAFTLFKLNRKQEAAEAYNNWKEAGHINDKDNYLIISYLMAVGRYDEVIGMNKIREDFLRQHNDTINYHMVTMKRTTGRAYEAKGNYKMAARYFNELAILTDSLKTREQNSAALELATVYETQEKEARIQQKNADLRERNMLLISAVVIILLLVITLWISIRHARTIRRKNQIMVQTINQLIQYKEEKRQDPKNEPDAVGDAAIRPDIPPVTNKELFDRLDNMVVSHQLYLNRNITREDLMKLIGVEKNRFGQILKEGNHPNITGYINNLRMELAVRILTENPAMPVSEVADKSGIPHLSTFYRVFKEKYEMTPAEFRDASKNSLKH